MVSPYALEPTREDSKQTQTHLPPIGEETEIDMDISEVYGNSEEETETEEPEEDPEE